MRTNLFHLLLIMLLLSSCATTERSTENTENPKVEEESLAEGQYYILRENEITQIQLESGKKINVIGIGRMKYGGNLGVFAVYESKEKFDLPSNMENEALGVVKALDEYIEETGLNYCFAQARSASTNGTVTNQSRAYGTIFKKVNQEWELARELR